MPKLALNLLYILFLFHERFVHLFNELVGQFLNILGPILGDVLTDAVLLFVRVFANPCSAPESSWHLCAIAGVR